MDILYGVEASNQLEEMDDFKDLLQKETNIFFKNDLLYIYQYVDDALLAKELLNIGTAYEANHELLYIHKYKQGELFFDYGIQKTDDEAFLFKEMIAAYYYEKGEQTAQQMAQFEIDEYLIAVTYESERPIYFVPQQHVQFIIRLVKAYAIEVSFLHLDKFKKNG